MGRYPALGDLAHCLRLKSYVVAGRQVQRIRVAVEDIFSFADTLRALPPIDLASSAKKHEDSFLAICGGSIDSAGPKPAHEKTHPLPPSRFTRQPEELAGLCGGQIFGVEQGI